MMASLSADVVIMGPHFLPSPGLTAKPNLDNSNSESQCKNFGELADLQSYLNVLMGSALTWSAGVSKQVYTFSSSTHSPPPTQTLSL